MRKKEQKPILLYSIADNKVDKIVDDYIDYVMNPYHIWRQTDEWQANDACIWTKKHPRPENYEHLPEMQPLRQRGEFDNRAPIYQLPHKPNRTRTEFCIRALIDMAYRQYLSSKSGRFSMNKSVLFAVFDESYPYLLTALFQHGVIFKDSNPMTIPHPEWFSCIHYPYAMSVLPYKQRTYQAIKDYKTKHKVGKLTENLLKSVGSSQSQFIQQYEKNISLLRFIDNEGLKLYMDKDSNFKSPHAKMSAQALVDKVNLDKGYMEEDKNIVSMGEREDKNHIGRFYHIGTSMKKELRKYSNLQYGIDAHNSHPLIFNYFILNYYLNNSLIDINTDFISLNTNNINLFYNISLFLFNNKISNNTYHYVMESLCNSLMDNNIIQDDVKKVKKLPFDVLKYIQDTSTGVIWDNIHSQFPQYTRNEIKKLMFRYVFYSYTTSTGYYDLKTRAYKTLNRKEWVDAFSACYPSVMRLINKYKKEYRKQCQDAQLIDDSGKELIQLSHLLMRFESVIFTRSLHDAFKEKLPVIGIHDCIAVIGDTIDIQQQNTLKGIILNRYKEVGLVPALGVERY